MFSGVLGFSAFLDVFRNVSRREAVERALANVCKMLGDPQLAKVSSEYFLPEINKTVTLSNIDAYKALTRLMVNAKNGWFVREKASFILGVLLSKSESLRNESFLSGEEEEEEGEEQRCSEEMQTARIVARWSIDLLGGGDGSLADTTFISGDGVGGTMTIQGGGRDENQEHNEDRVIPTAIHALASVLQHRKTRPLVRNLGAYKLIAPLLDSEKVNPNCRVQVLYEAALCAWLLSFDAKARKQALKVDNAIVVRNLIKVAKTATKEKVVRVAGGVRNQKRKTKQIKARIGIDSHSSNKDFLKFLRKTVISNSHRLHLHLHLRHQPGGDLTHCISIFCTDQTARHYCDMRGRREINDNRIIISNTHYTKLSPLLL